MRLVPGVDNVLHHKRFSYVSTTCVHSNKMLICKTIFCLDVRARRENMDLHDILLLAPETPCKTLDSLALKRPAMLAVVSIAADKSLLQETKVAHDRLAKIIEAVQRCLHPCGSMALFVPRPWKQHYPRLIGER